MKIGLTSRLDITNDTKEIRSSVDVNWISFIRPIAETIDIFQTYDAHSILDVSDFDLVIFTGGNDLSTQTDNFLSKMRDDCEIKLLADCLKHDVAVLGVCRGMQLIHHFFDGALNRVAGHVAVNHEIEATTNWLRDINVVNSYHNWGIDEASLSPDFEISARCKHDGSVEAIEHRYLRVRGIMWHPERWNEDLEILDIYRQRHQNILGYVK